MKKIAQILARYTAWVLGLMKVLGIWGVFVIAFADSALLGMPVDFIVATYVYQDHKRMLLYVAMASLGSALGSIQTVCSSRLCVVDTYRHRLFFLIQQVPVTMGSADCDFSVHRNYLRTPSACVIRNFNG